MLKKILAFSVLPCLAFAQSSSEALGQLVAGNQRYVSGSESSRSLFCVGDGT